MKSLAYASIAMALIATVFAVLTKLGLPPIFNVGPAGSSKAASVLLLFGINFELLELLKK